MSEQKAEYKVDKIYDIPYHIIGMLDEIQKWIDTKSLVIHMETGENWNIGTNMVIKISFHAADGMVPREQNKKSGYVYLLHCPTNNLYKIGRSKNTPLRHYEIEKQSPVDIVLLHTFYSKNSSNAEKILHDKNINKRIKGEWFNLSNEEVEEIKDIGDYEL